IQPPDLEAAPSPEEVCVQLRSLIQDRPLVYAGGPAAARALQALLGDLPQTCIDLDELIDLFHSEALPPELGSRAAFLGIDLVSENPSQQAEDLIAAIYERLSEEAALLQPGLLAEIAQRCAASNWPLRYFFTDAAGATALNANPLGPNLALTQTSAGDVRQPPSAPPRGRAPRPSGVVQGNDIAGTLEEATAAPGAGYEPRPQQVDMMEAVGQALEGEYHLLVEAGTGTGKSLAYLLPAAARALRSGERVVVSTNTINLQEQLAQKDIPSVRRLLGDYGPPDLRRDAESLRSTSLKGRRNYLCLQRLAVLRRTPILTETEARFLVRMLLWLARGGGDRAGLRLDADEDAIWSRVSAEGSTCFASSSPFVRNGSCQLMRARARAEAAHLVVVNHSLLLSDIAAERHILPQYDRLIVDEAHNLEDVATDQFGFHAGQGEIVTLMDAVAARTRDREVGIVADARAATRAAAAEPDREYFDSLLRDLFDRVDRARRLAPDAFGVVATFARAHGDADGDYDRRVLLTRGTRAQPEWTQVELAWENLDLALVEVETGLERLGVAVAARPVEAVLDRDALLGAVAGQELAIRLVREGIEGVIYRHDDQRVAWLTVSRTGGAVTAASAPLNVGETLNSYLFGRKASVVLTSATLTSGGTFDYVRERLGLAEVEELSVGSPFDYERSALLLLPSDIPEPSQHGYQPAVEHALIQLAVASEGRALVLFTSHAALRASYRAIGPALSAKGIRVLAQGIDGTPQDLVGELRADPRTVICGTSSFWEGVDVVGEALSLLVITKLPFSVPSDPVFTARAEQFEQPFRDYALPQAVLRFKQGFGRLIRHRDDRGVVAVLDRRLRSKSYGRVFLKSLPPCTIRDTPTQASGALVLEWLAAREAQRTG
ncbi:MAG TPA: helicase C-terminal domain-containing protein, partial [Dehalococcoidia bacterium]|nr:helicase C-terminal domain-containing protein [Dehalococcoidia bacterium]